VSNPETQAQNVLCKWIITSYMSPDADAIMLYEAVSHRTGSFYGTLPAGRGRGHGTLIRSIFPMWPFKLFFIERHNFLIWNMCGLGSKARRNVVAEMVVQEHVSISKKPSFM
jgi:hypothetical protein